MVKLGWETYSFGADVFGATAFLLTLVGSARCDFIKFTSVDGTFTDHFGVWRYGQWAYLTTGEQAWLYEGCFPYADSVVIDSKWKAARAFDAMVLIGGLLFFMMSAFSACLGKRTYTRPNGIVGVCLLLLSLFSGLTLLILDSNLCKNNVLLGELFQFLFNDQCELSTGANCFISATVFWFAAALCSLSASRSKSEENDEVEGGLTESLIQGEP
mmetsp:Transcript_2890/g.6107  ORF Transcript_2890/g.6107 Transcript_2890/m.6107 type:complete len:214 (-) Transcript_2890:134-775(-)